MHVSPLHHSARLGSITLALLMVAGTASAQMAASSPSGSASRGGMSSMSSGTSSKLARGDVAFLKQASQNGHAEVDASKIALEKSSNPQIKTFAQQMIDDHTKAGNDLAALASSKGVEVPDKPSIAQQGKAKLMQAMSGATFDKRYASETGVSDHQATVDLFRKASSSAQDADVKAFAAKTLPTLEHHLQMAQDLKTSVNGSGSTKTSSAK